MLDLKAVLLKKYQSVLELTSSTISKKIIATYEKIKDPVIYSSFLAEACQGVKSKSPHRMTYPEILSEIEKRAEKIGTENVTADQLTDSIELYEAYNNAVRLLMKAKREYDMSFPYTTFMELKSHMTALEFVVGFDKTKYPLVKDWEEFVVALPDFLRMKGQDKALVKFGSYFYFAKHGDFDKWYARAKGYGGGKTDWDEAFRDEVRGYSDERLEEEHCSSIWGWQILHDEWTRRKRNRMELANA